MNPSEYVEIGYFLRDSRESLRISIEQAAQDLHIRAKYLEALESGNLQGLPGKSYTRGYIRNYAQYLMLNVDEVLAAYAAHLGPKISELFIPEPTSRQSLPAHMLVWVSFAGLILLYSIWYFGFHDRTSIARNILDMPEKFAHLLDKNPETAMDKPWVTCLSEENVACVVRLRVQVAKAPNVMIYDVPTNTASQEQ